MRNRFGMSALVAALMLTGVARAETDPFDAERFLDIRGAETTALIASDLSGPSLVAALDRAEAAGEAEAASLDRTEPAGDLGSIDLATVVAPVADAATDHAPELDIMGALAETTGAVAADAPAPIDEALPAVVADGGEASSDHHAPSHASSEPVELPMDGVEPTTGP